VGRREVRIVLVIGAMLPRINLKCIRFSIAYAYKTATGHRHQAVEPSAGGSAQRRAGAVVTKHGAGNLPRDRPDQSIAIGVLQGAGLVGDLAERDGPFARWTPAAAGGWREVACMALRPVARLLRAKKLRPCVPKKRRVRDFFAWRNFMSYHTLWTKNAQLLQHQYRCAKELPYVRRDVSGASRPR